MSNNKTTDTKKKVCVYMKEVESCNDCLLLGGIQRKNMSPIPMCAYLGGTPPRSRKPTDRCKRHFGKHVEILAVMFNIFGITPNTKQLTLNYGEEEKDSHICH